MLLVSRRVNDVKVLLGRNKRLGACLSLYGMCILLVNVLKLANWKLVICVSCEVRLRRKECFTLTQ